MLSPGEQPRGMSRAKRVQAMLFVLLVLGPGAVLWRSPSATEYRLYLTSERLPAMLDFQALAEDWSEKRLRQAYPNLPIRCGRYAGPLPADKACAVDVNATNEVPTLFMTFFFRGDRLQVVSLNVPWWSHTSAHSYARGAWGEPVASQFLPRAFVRLDGWKLAGGAAVFLNRDRPLNPFEWSSIQWFSPEMCRRQSCFVD